MAKESIFSLLREQRVAAHNTVNEGTETPAEEPVVETPAEEPVVEGVETPAEEPVVEGAETPAEEPVVEGVSEEIVMVACPHCGLLEALNESGETELEACPHCGEEELVEKVVKVVRDGEVVKKKVKTKKTRLTAAQKQALAKARKKAHSAGANKARAKSNKIRNKKGLNDEDYAECPECGWTGDISELVDGCCPECQAKVSEACGKKNEAVDEILNAVNNLSEEELVELKKALGKEE